VPTGVESQFVASVLADSPTTAAPEQSGPEGASSGSPAPPSAGSVPPNTPATGARPCERCGAVMATGQDWCLQCGAGAPGSIGTPGWRSAATVLIASAVLVLGAAAAAYAALSKGTPATHMVTTTVAQAPAPTATVPTTSTTPALTTKAGETPGATKTVPLPKIKTPKIPLTPTVTPSTGTGTTPGTTTSKTTATTPTTPSSNEGGAGTEAIVLDTNAASTYNPYNYAASDFGDPSLAIDGDTSTSWVAQVEPSTAPQMADGVLIDLKAQQKIASMVLITSTPGMIVQAYGTTGKTAPTSITDPGWVALNGPRVTQKKHVKMKLRDSSKEFYYVLLWISHAPSTSTPAAPGHVSVNELELFPPAS
jgi:hypothetical protein